MSDVPVIASVSATEMTMFIVYAVMEPNDRVLGLPTDEPRVVSLWSTRDKAESEARGLSDYHGYAFTVREFEVDGMPWDEGRWERGC